MEELNHDQEIFNTTINRLRHYDYHKRSCYFNGPSHVSKLSLVSHDIEKPDRVSDRAGGFCRLFIITIIDLLCYRKVGSK